MILNNIKNKIVIVKHHICDYHKKHPEDISYAGCTCGSCATLSSKKPDPCEDCDPKENPLCDKCIGS